MNMKIGSVNPRKRKREESFGLLTGGGRFPSSSIPLTNLELWLKADAIVGLVDNDPVATWEDSSPNNNDATQGVAGARPLYKVSIINGLPIVRFDAVDDGMGTPNNVFANPFSVFVVYSGTIAAGSHRAINSLDSGFFIGTDNDQHMMFNGALIGDSPGSLVNGVFAQATYIHNGAIGQFWVDGASIGTNANSDAPGRMSLGNTGAAGGPLNGDIAEVIAYGADMSSQRVAIESYLMNKYAI